MSESKGHQLSGAGPGRPKGKTHVQVPKQLRDMRIVYNSEKPREDGQTEYEKFPNDSPGVAQYRELLRRDRKSFLDKLDKAEKDYRDACNALKEKREKAGKGAEVPKDAGSVQLVGLINNLLDNWEELQRGESSDTAEGTGN